MKTPADVYNLGLSYVGAVGAGQTPSAEDLAIAARQFRPLIEELAARDIAYIPIDPDDDLAPCIEEQFYAVLGELLANQMAPEFGQPASDSLRASAEIRLRRMTSTGSYEQVQQSEYF